MSDPTRDMLIERAHRERRIAGVLLDQMPQTYGPDDPLMERVVRHYDNAADYDRQLAEYDRERSKG